MQRHSEKIKFFGLLSLSITLLLVLLLPSYYGFASSQNKTLMQPQGVSDVAATNATNIVLVHGVK